MVRLPYPAPVSVRKIPETVSEFALVRLKIPRCLILLFVSQRSADTSYRLHGTHSVDDLQSSVCPWPSNLSCSPCPRCACAWDAKNSIIGVAFLSLGAIAGSFQTASRVFKK